MNLVILAGNISNDITKTTTQSGKSRVSFNIAVDDYDGEKRTTDFVRCTAFGAKADFIANYFHKGKGICIRGKIKPGSYPDKNHSDVTHYTQDVWVVDAEFPPSSGKNDNNNGGGYQNQQNGYQNQQGGYQQNNSYSGSYQQNPPPQNGYQNQQNGYQNQQGSYQQNGYQNQQGGYQQPPAQQAQQAPPPQGGYQQAPPQQGYQQPPAQQAPPQQNGYQNQQGGYQQPPAQQAQQAPPPQQGYQQPPAQQAPPQQASLSDYEEILSADDVPF